ncbi:hypothetical protein Pla108_03970 [Botrimarina colliarenosi]|uniref:PEP-CTERM protein-sorting domain-containing protein n=1 Tax=Botrimarina colliarenosi TaxID=2528001 RepID=A0A5C6AJN0_9BACT|nr:hypothetical protein [Botrimarina colliarenosi]TWT99458.1 hypothetical protein Pla108_03970 [Botrimarina colliarenosi]
MCRRCKCLSIFGSVIAVVLLLNTTLNAGIIVNDSFADGDLTKTGALDTNWWTSSSSSGIEVSAGSLGLVTGSSGRGIHTVFPTQTLSNLGDSVKATYTFTAPATVGTGSGSFRVGLFDTLGRAGLDGDVSASSGSPNALFGWSVVNGGPGDPGLPGYLMDMDVNDGTDDLNIRKHITNSATGRLMSTTGNGSFSSLGNGDNNVYSFAANTEYTGSMSMTRISATEVEIAGTLGAASFSITDTFDSIDVGMLAFHVNSNQFGSSSTAGDPNNGIDFSNVTIEFSSVPEPSTLICAIGSLIFYPGFGRRRRSH